LCHEAKEHALLALRLSPRDIWVGIAQLALAMASYTAREYAETVHWAELAIQSAPSAPIRRAIMIACCAGLVISSGQRRSGRRSTASPLISSPACSAVRTGYSPGRRAWGTC
jgi:hypothetical protein